jgi:hypothetical protein
MYNIVLFPFKCLVEILLDLDKGFYEVIFFVYIIFILISNENKMPFILALHSVCLGEILESVQ